MKNIVITGGTSGLGEELARTYLNRGDNVLVVGPNSDKGKTYLAEAERAGAGERAFFLRADLSLVSENERVIGEITERFPVIDALVLCARFFRSFRRETSEGYEHNFALYYLSRFLFSHRLADALDQAQDPVIVNVAGPGVPAGRVHWDDLGLERGYDGWEAMFQSGKLNDLLGVSFAAAGVRRTRYVLLFPGGTSTGFAGELDAETAGHVEEMKRTAKPAAEGIVPIVGVIDTPPVEPLTAVVEGGRRLSLAHASFDAGDAARLHRLTEELLTRR